jgi:hypothetical protein
MTQTSSAGCIGNRNVRLLRPATNTRMHHLSPQISREAARRLEAADGPHAVADSSDVSTAAPAPRGVHAALRVWPHAKRWQSR